MQSLFIQEKKKKAYAKHHTSSSSQISCLPATEFCQLCSICHPHLAYRVIDKHFKDFQQIQLQGTRTLT